MCAPLPRGYDRDERGGGESSQGRWDTSSRGPGRWSGWRVSFLSFVCRCFFIKYRPLCIFCCVVSCVLLCGPRFSLVDFSPIRGGGVLCFAACASPIFFSLIDPRPGKRTSVRARRRGRSWTPSSCPRATTRRRPSCSTARTPASTLTSTTRFPWRLLGRAVRWPSSRLTRSTSARMCVRTSRYQLVCFPPRE
jgi:hypothetical protein